MCKVMLVQPWNYHDEGIVEHDLTWEWRNGPYSLLLLATELRNKGHNVVLIDMIRDLVVLKGDLAACLHRFEAAISEFRPEIIGFGFFSMHYFEVKKAVELAHSTCRRVGINPLFIAGGIHASTEPHRTVEDLGFDYSFVGEGDVGLVKLADGHNPTSVQGVVGSETLSHGKGEEVRPLDDLPFPDWSLCDYKFYAAPSLAKIKLRPARTLDMIMGRGCVYRCAFCAYNALSSVRFYSPEYLVEQVGYMHRQFGIDSVYFTDSTIGNNRRQVEQFSELMLQTGLANSVHWFANIRPNQINEKFLQLIWRAGCRFLFHGFESGSQRVLDLMVKGMKVEWNYIAAELHNKLKFPYHASIMLGYPGEREEDVMQTFDFLRKVKPPMIGINEYVPLPGAPDYDLLKSKGILDIEDPQEWRRIGESNASRVYADIPEARFRELLLQARAFAYTEIPRQVRPAWGCLAPPQSEIKEEDLRQAEDPKSG